MPAQENAIRVVAIGDPGPTQQQVMTALSTQHEFQFVDALNDMEHLMRDLRVVDPEILLVDHMVGGQPTLDIIDDLTQQFPQATVIAILPNENPIYAQQAMLAGARAFLVQPFTQVNLMSTIRRVYELEARRKQAQLPLQGSKTSEANITKIRTLAVFSSRGGVGCSTIATNMAISLHEQTGARVLLMEGKLFFGHLDVMLNIRTKNTLADLLPHAANLDENLVRDVISKHVSGIDVLLAPSDVQTAQGVRAQDVYNVITALQRLYEFIVIDVGSVFNESTVTLMDAADRILLVTMPDLAAMHDVGRFITISRTLAYPPQKTLVVLNRAGILGGIRSKEIESVLRQQLFIQVPDDGPNVQRSLNRGIPLLLTYPRSPTSKSIEQLCKAIIGLNEAEAVQAATVEKRGKVPARKAQTA